MVAFLYILSILLGLTPPARMGSLSTATTTAVSAAAARPAIRRGKKARTTQSKRSRHCTAADNDNRPSDSGNTNDSTDSSDSELDYYGRQVNSDSKNDNKNDSESNRPSAAMVPSQQLEQQPQGTTPGEAAVTAEPVLGTKYLGSVYHKSQIPDLAHEIQAAVRFLDERRLKSRDWWALSSGANATGTRLCAYCQVVGRRGAQWCRWTAGFQYACNVCTAAGRMCLHSAVVEGQMVIVAKDPQEPGKTSSKPRS